MAVLDTSFYVTTVDPKDPLHSVARAWMAAAITAGEPLFAPWILATEVGAAVRRGLGDAALAHETVSELADADAVHLLPVDASLASRAAAIAIDHRIRG